MNTDTLIQLFPYLMAGLGAGMAIFYILRYLRRFKQVRRLQRGREMEKEGLKFLEKQGYYLVDYQPELRHEFRVNGENKEVKIHPDVRVRKGGKEFLVEIKSGEKAVHPEYGATRRQLLEYAVVNGKSNILLLDMEAQTISKVEFPLIKPGGNWKVTFWKTIALVLLGGYIVVITYLAVIALFQIK